MLKKVRWARTAPGSPLTAAPDGHAGKLFGGALDLPVFELDRREPAEDGDGNLQLAAFRIDLVDATGQRSECSIGDFDFLADGVLHLRHFLAAGGLDSRMDFVDLGLAERGRAIAA